MTFQPIQSVFFWRATMISVFKAAYGRKPSGSTYTKDFHQPRGELARALDRALGIRAGETTNVEWRWPGGSYDEGKYFPAADFDESSGRMNLRWQTDSAPPPWRLVTEPTGTTVSTLRGTPDLQSESSADAQLVQIKETGEDPWFLAVHLHGEEAVLHARLALMNPQPGREFAGVSRLPGAIQRAIKELPSNKPGGFIEFEEGYMPSNNEIVSQILSAFEQNNNVLLVGPPGTGKTHAMEEVQRAFESSASVTFDPNVLHGSFEESTATPFVTRVAPLVFHPSYTYQEFVMGLLPEPVEGGVGVKPVPGPLIELAQFAAKPGQRALLICDEFNRGAASSIFGDTLGLLDSDKRSVPGQQLSGTRIHTPYAHLSPVTSDGSEIPATLSLPDTLYILAAMNSADRSVAPLDAALRRRFSIVHVAPDYEALRSHLGISADLVFNKDPIEWTTSDHIKELGVRALEAINERIESISGRDFLIGQSVLWDVSGERSDEVLTSLAEAMDNRVIGTLTLTYTDEDASLAGVLNVDPNGVEHTDGAAYWHKPPERLEGIAAPRLRPVRFQELSTHDLLGALESLL